MDASPPVHKTNRFSGWSFFDAPAWLHRFPRVLADFATKSTGPDTATFRSLLVICLSGAPGPKARKSAKAVRHTH